jgi:hypothetical protein
VEIQAQLEKEITNGEGDWRGGGVTFAENRNRKENEARRTGKEERTNGK